MSMSPDEIKTYAREVAEKLGEKADAPIQQIELVIEHMGREFVETYVKKTEELEAAGGLKTEDGKRRRTKGGVFFYVVKGQMTADIRSKIFPNYGGDKGRAIGWDEREEFIKPLLEADEPGKMRYVTITLHGRPGEVVVEENSVMTTIAHQHKQTPLQRGVPHPPQDESTTYTVYMSSKQWDAVKETIAKYKGDRLIVEGTCFMDYETDTIAVFATSVTTRRLEKEARREPQPEESAPQPAPTATPAPTPIAPPPPEPPEITVDLPGAPPEVVQKLQQLHNAAQTLRDRIAGMEAKGQPGVSMTKKLLKNTEKQIAALENQYAKS